MHMPGVGLADHYGVLEVDREADETAVKKAYRRLVLQWHPDKHPDKREAAEEKIRDINDAYETLGNPFKRSQYDQQILALERKARGFRLDTTSIKPRMSIPKEFMLSPMGHPDKFVRTVGMSVFVQSRADAKMEFYDFFKDAKFSLWWLPEVNNMCRLRPTSTAGVGQDGGMNFNFMLHRTTNVSEVILSPGTLPESANVIAVASPVFSGAFRFEAAHFPGHYLAYKPPTHLRMVGGIVDEITTIDFLLVDYAKMFNYITAEEVLAPAVTSLGGDKNYVSLNTLRMEANVVLYFQNVLRKAIWADDDFETFFESRSGEWDYDSELGRVRLRSKHAQLENSIRRARTPSDLASAISAADDYDVCFLRLETLEGVLSELGRPLPPMADVTLVVNTLDAQKKILVAMPKACEKNVSFRRLLSICAKVEAFGGEQADAKVAERRAETGKELGELVSDKIRYHDVSEDVTLSVLSTLCHMPLDWRACGERLGKLALRLLEGQALGAVAPLLQAVVKGLPASQPFAERLAELARGLLKGAEPRAVAETLECMVSGSLCLDCVPGNLAGVMDAAPFPLVASIVAGLGEMGAEGDGVRTCGEFLGKARSKLEALPPAMLLRLCVAATKSALVAEAALDAVAAAAAITLPAWTADDASKLLLAVAKAKKGTGGSTGVAGLYERASEVLRTKLSEFSSVQLIKVVLAIGQVAACRPLLESVAMEAACNRLSDLPSAQLLLLTQGLLPLTGEHAALVRLLDHLASGFDQVSRAENLLTESMGLELVRQRRGELEAKGQLTADQLAKLAQMLAPVAPKHEYFWKALVERFTGQGEAEGVAGELGVAGKATLDTAFPRGAGPEFPGKSKLLHAVKEARKPPKPKEGTKDRGQDRPRSRERTRGSTSATPPEPAASRRTSESAAGHASRARGAKEGRGSSESESRQRQRRRRDAGSDRDREKGRARDRGRSGSASRSRHREKQASAERGRREENGKRRDRDRGRSRSKSRSRSRAKDGKKGGKADQGDRKRHGGDAEEGKRAREEEELRKREAEEEQEKRRQQRERRQRLTEDKDRQRADEKKREDDDGQKREAEEQERRKLQRERRAKLRQEEQGLEDKRKEEAAAEAERRKLQRERRKGRQAEAAGRAVVQLDD